MHKTSFIIRAVVWGAALSGSIAAMADPVSDADLRGKKICWNTGGTSAYNKDGSFDGTRSGHGTWSLTGDLLSVNAEHGTGAGTITKDSGTFHLAWTARHGKGQEIWGKYCN
jgi:hypothetical protein